MADTKITALAAITTVDPAADVLPIVDVSDTSMAASGTTKKITSNQLLGAGGTATLASATITGALTVDTTTLVVNASTDRVGIGTATPARPLDIVGSFQSSLGWVLVGTPAGLGGATRYIGGASTTDSWYYNGLTGGSQIWAFGESTAMTLNSTGLGVGAASPSYKLDVNGVARVNSGGDGLFLSSAAGPDLYIVGTNYYNNNGTEGVQTVARPSWKIEHKNSSDALAYLDIGFRAASAAASAFTSRFKIDGTGQVGIGVTPSYKLDTYTTLGGTVNEKRFANRTSNKILVKRYFSISADTALFSIECGTAGSSNMAAFEINVFATGTKLGISSDRQFYGKFYVTRNLAGTFAITSAFSSGSSGAFTVTASGTSLNVNGIFSVISDGSACVEITGYIGGRDTIAEANLTVTMP